MCDEVAAVFGSLEQVVGIGGMLTGLGVAL
jgi:hypothetical protein